MFGCLFPLHLFFTDKTIEDEHEIDKTDIDKDDEIDKTDIDKDDEIDKTESIDVELDEISREMFRIFMPYMIAYRVCREAMITSRPIDPSEIPIGVVE